MEQISNNQHQVKKFKDVQKMTSDCEVLILLFDTHQWGRVNLFMSPPPHSDIQGTMKKTFVCIMYSIINNLFWMFQKNKLKIEK